MEALHAQADSGKDLSKLLGDLIGHFRNLLVYQVDPKEVAKELAPEVVEILASQSASVSAERIMRLIDVLAEIDGRMKWAPNKKLHLEIGLIRAVRSLGETSIDDVISLLSDAAAARPTPCACATPRRCPLCRPRS